MENYSFKTVAFGGFDKQDVVRYLEQTAEKTAAAQRELERENEELRDRAEELTGQMEELRSQMEELAAQRDQLQSQLEKEIGVREGLESLRGDVERLTAEAGSLRPDAEAYARFRERLGSIECEARNRADNLEESAAAQTRRTTEAFQSQYRRLMDIFTASADRVTQELQKIEAVMAELPRGMEETETELDALVRNMQRGRDGRTLYFSNSQPEAEATEAAELPEPLPEDAEAPFLEKEF